MSGSQPGPTASTSTTGNIPLPDQQCPCPTCPQFFHYFPIVAAHRTETDTYKLIHVITAVKAYCAGQIPGPMAPEGKYMVSARVRHGPSARHYVFFGPGPTPNSPLFALQDFENPLALQRTFDLHLAAYSFSSCAQHRATLDILVYDLD